MEFQQTKCFPSPSSPPFSSNVYDPSKSLDLSSLESVKSWVEEVGGVVPYVSHVALNAGVMSVPLEPRNEETGVEPQLHTNHVGKMGEGGRGGERQARFFFAR